MPAFRKVSSPPHALHPVCTQTSSHTCELTKPHPFVVSEDMDGLAERLSKMENELKLLKITNGSGGSEGGVDADQMS